MHCQKCHKGISAKSYRLPHPVVERVLKKHTQVKVHLPSKKCSVSRVKVLVKKPT